MAEGFARAYGSDVLKPASAGLMPIASVPTLTRKVMIEKNIPIDQQFPKGVELFKTTRLDVVVNMSGMVLPPYLTPTMRTWVVADPYGRSEGAFRQVRDQIEELVMKLVLELRASNKQQAPASVRRRLRG
jgi:arsenate reductase